MKAIRKILFAAVAVAFVPCLFAEINPNDVNKKFGFNLMGDANLWDDSAADMTKRIGAPFESTKLADSSVYTTYAKGKSGLAAMLAQIRITEKAGKVSQVDLVFFNKGDSAGGKKTKQKTQSPTKQLASIEKQQLASIRKSLNEFSGEAAAGTWGYGRTKNKAEIWNYENIVLSLEHKPKEFIILHITPAGADVSANQKSVAAADFDGKVNVANSPNGDVFIKNIPMVDQGPKGYCVPATIERVLKYYSIPDIDMHKIAAACKTSAGGGTTLAGVKNDFKKVCNTFKLRMSDVGSFSMNSIVSMVDKGIPICWALFSTEPYTKRMMGNSEKRKSETNFDNYMSFINGQKKLSKAREGPHVCLIIGYNKKSKEIAVSNSWGERFDIAWVRFDDAKIVSNSLFVINPR